MPAERSCTTEPIPFNRPYAGPGTAEAIADAVQRGHLSGDGHYTALAAAALRSITSVDHAFLTPSCTHALELAALALDLGPGDEVIMPSYTFVSTANAFALRGARPVFVDIRPDTFNIDEQLVLDAITERTRAIVVVHYAGVGAEMGRLCRIAADHGLAIVEDNAHGLGGTYDGRPLGSFGAFATLSFHETKNVQCGEGGALLVRDESMAERVEVIREKGTNRSRFFRGQVDKYTWVSLGSSYLMSDLAAAFLTAQLQMFDHIQARRRHVWDRYRTELAPWAARSGFAFQVCPPMCEHPAHLFALLAPDLTTRTAFIDHLRSLDVFAVFHYVPLHSSPFGSTFGERHLPVTDDVGDRLVRLPLHVHLDDRAVDRVVDAVCSFRS